VKKIMAIQNVLTVDVVDYFQVSAFSKSINQKDLIVATQKHGVVPITF